MRALAAGVLPARRDNRNAWQIAADDLDRWASDRSGPAPDRAPVSALPDPSDTPATLARLAVAEARLADVTADRDRLAKLLEKALEARPSGFFARLLGWR